MITDPDPERLAEVLLFAQPGPVSAATLAAVLPEGADAREELIEMGDDWTKRGVHRRPETLAENV